jgi:hypothetical protein
MAISSECEVEANTEANSGPVGLVLRSRAATTGALVG